MRENNFCSSQRSLFLIVIYRIMPEHLGLLKIIEDVSISNEYEYENDLMPYSYSKSFSQLSMLAMTSSSSL